MQLYVNGVRNVQEFTVAQFSIFLFISWITFLLNIPLGLWRKSLKKLSPAWFLAVHLSIPLIVVFRVHAGLSLIYVPAVIAIAMIGQRVGGKILIKTNNLVEKPID